MIHCICSTLQEIYGGSILVCEELVIASKMGSSGTSTIFISTSQKIICYDLSGNDEILLRQNLPKTPAGDFARIAMGLSVLAVFLDSWERYTAWRVSLTGPLLGRLSAYFFLG